MSKSENKLDKDNTLKTIRNERKKTKVGAPSFDERELTQEMIKFCQYLGQGQDPKEVGKIMGLSDYIIKTWPTQKNIQEEVKRWTRLYTLEKHKMWKELADDLTIDAFKRVKELINQHELGTKEGEREYNLLMKFIDRKFQQLETLDKEELKQLENTEVEEIEYKARRTRKLGGSLMDELEEDEDIVEGEVEESKQIEDKGENDECNN